MQYFWIENHDIIVRLGLALILGMTIGIERIIAHKTAGMRTYALVAMGSALFVSISQYMVGHFVDGTFGAAVIPAAIVSGIGFLGAGLIIFKDSHLTGVTTATSIWVSAGIGMAAGFGLSALAIIATVMTLFIFVILWFIEEQIKKIPKEMGRSDTKPF